MEFEYQQEKSWLTPNNARRRITNPYSGQEFSRDTNYSSIQGQIVESVATGIISGGYWSVF